MPRLPADEPPSRVLSEVGRSLRRGFRRRLLSLLVTSVVLAGATAAATAGATTAAYRRLNPPTTSPSDTTSSLSSAPTPSSIGAPRPGMASIRVKLRSFTGTTADGVQWKRRYAEISGHPDPAVQQRVNKVLRQPVDREISVANYFVDSGDILATDAKVTLQTPWLLSVEYFSRKVDPATGYPQKNLYWTESVIVDLTDGRRLGARDLFLPATLTTTGLQTLVEQLLASKQSPTLCLGGRRGETPPPDLRANLGRQIVSDPPPLSLYPQHIAFDLGPGFGPQVCKTVVVEVPYDKIADLMRPDARARVRS
jgi:hypothetical protein